MFPHLDTVAEYRRLEHQLLLAEASRLPRVDRPTARRHSSPFRASRLLVPVRSHLSLNRFGILRPSAGAGPS